MVQQGKCETCGRESQKLIKKRVTGTLRCQVCVTTDIDAQRARLGPDAKCSRCGESEKMLRRKRGEPGVLRCQNCITKANHAKAGGAYRYSTMVPARLRAHQRQRQQARSENQADPQNRWNRHELYSDAEIARILDPNRPIDRELSRRLGRSIDGIQAKRRRLETEQPKDPSH